MSITIPFVNGSGGVQFFPDELPSDYIDLINVLRSEVPPLEAWRLCAVEYFKQGEEEAFDNILEDILSLVNSDDNQFYERSRPENVEAITNINIARAAKELWKMSRPRSGHFELQQDSVHASYARFIELEKSINKMSEFFWLVKGFVQVIQGNIKEADDSFSQVMNMASKVAAKSIYLFGSLVGKGLVLYHQKRYAAAAEHFTKAVFRKPDCDGSLRILLATCFFRLGQFEKAQEALMVSMGRTSNANQLVLWGLLELELSKKDVNDRMNRLQKFRDFMLMAHQLDDKNPVVLNMLANDAFNSWKSFVGLSSIRMIDSSTISVEDDIFISGLNKGDQLRILSCESTITSINKMDLSNVYLVSISPPVRGNVDDVAVDAIDVRHFKLATDVATKALHLSRNAHCKAESLYILGKIAHAQNNLKLAYEYYLSASKESQEMHLAHFGAAEILFVNNDLDAALKLFEDIEANFPGDKDTQAYISLLNGILKKKVTSLEKLNEFASGFSFEYELWVSQGQLRLQKMAEHETALVCLTNAKKLAEAQELFVDTTLLSNIAILDHYLGNSASALVKLKALIVSKKNSCPATPAALLRHVEFENIFYEWKLVDAELTQVENKMFYSSSPIRDVVVGSELKIGGVIWRVVELVDGHQFRAENAFGDFFHIGNVAFYEIKCGCNNFGDEVLNISYNFSRILEDDGLTQASISLYEEIIKLHPSFVDVYVRLSVICNSMNKFEQSRQWLAVAKLCKPEDPEIDVLLSGTTNDDLDESKRILSHSSKQHSKDAQLLLALGNAHLLTSFRKQNDEGALKISYKFFHSVLGDHKNNPYAANGLGIVCALKGELSASDAIFSKLRQVHVPRVLGNSLDLNLAYVQYLEKRYQESERHVFSVLRSSLKTSTPADVAMCYNFHAVLQRCLEQKTDSHRSNMRALHFNAIDMMDSINIKDKVSKTKRKWDDHQAN